jgi:hypothetical protein
MVLPVRRRIHWGMGRFCFWALASFCLVRKDLWLCGREELVSLLSSEAKIHDIDARRSPQPMRTIAYRFVLSNAVSSIRE